MQVPEIVLAMRAVEEGELDRTDLSRLFSILESWDRADLKISCGELLVREFRVAAAKVRRWESEIGGAPSRRVGQYELRRRIGQGGMGIVFEAVHPNLDRPVAVKILPPSHGTNPEAVQRFLTETKSAGRFNDPHIVHAYDAGIDDNIPFLVMEYIDGENLYQLLQRVGRLDIDLVRDLLGQAAHALLVLEEAGWVHGDGKPSNWILDNSGTLKLADLGLCRPPGRPGGTIFGSPPYIAPELLRAGASPDHRVDLYSLGATFYHLVTGKPPYPATSVAELARCQKASEIPPVRELRSDVPEDLARLIEDLLHADPMRRIASSRDVLMRLGVLAVPERQGEVAETRLRPALLAAVALVLVVIGYWAAQAFLMPESGREEGDGTEGEIAAEGAPSEDAKAAGASLPPAAGSEDAEWLRLWQEEPRQYVELAAWLEQFAAQHPQREEWQGNLERALGAEAAPLWESVSVDVANLSAQRQQGAALARLAEFPARLRAGRYAVVWEQARVGLETKRERVAARARLEIETALAAGDMPRASRAFASLSAEPLSEQSWLRTRVAREWSELPWVAAALQGEREVDVARAERRQRLRDALAVGTLPVALPVAEADWTTEVAVAVLERFPTVVEAPQRPVWQRLYESGCLAAGPDNGELIRAVVALIDPSALDQRNATDECRAAWWQRQAEAACQRWDLAAAESAWTELQQLPNTLAAVDESRSLAERRSELRRGAFLRSDAFVAAVSVHWGTAPTFSYSGANPRLFEEWRHREGDWLQTPEGVHCRTSGPELLELIVPFVAAGSSTVADAPPLRLEASLRFPDEWIVFFSDGVTAVAVGRTSLGEVVVAVDSPGAVLERLRKDPQRWTNADQTFLAGSASVSAEFGSAVTLRAGRQTLALPLPHATSLDPEASARIDRSRPRWASVAATRDVVLRQIAIVGAPHPQWLAAREAAIAQQRALEDPK